MNHYVHNEHAGPVIMPRMTEHNTCISAPMGFSCGTGTVEGGILTRLLYFEHGTCGEMYVDLF